MVNAISAQTKSCREREMSRAADDPKICCACGSLRRLRPKAKGVALAGQHSLRIYVCSTPLCR